MCIVSRVIICNARFDSKERGEVAKFAILVRRGPNSRAHEERLIVLYPVAGFWQVPTATPCLCSSYVVLARTHTRSIRRIRILRQAHSPARLQNLYLCRISYRVKRQDQTSSFKIDRNSRYALTIANPRIVILEFDPLKLCRQSFRYFVRVFWTPE